MYLYDDIKIKSISGKQDLSCTYQQSQIITLRTYSNDMISIYLETQASGLSTTAGYFYVYKDDFLLPPERILMHLPEYHRI